MSWAMASATRVACDKEGDGNSGKSSGNKGGRQATATRVMAMATATTWAMEMATTSERQIPDLVIFFVLSNR